MGTIVLSDDLGAAISADVGHAVVIRTPLNLITHLENPSAIVDAVVLAGRYRDRQLAMLLQEMYPRVRVLLAPIAATPTDPPLGFRRPMLRDDA
jgi:hypothetical protein